MAKSKNSKTKWIWLSVLILLVCVAATTIAFFSRLDMFLLDDEGVIALLPDENLQTESSRIDTNSTQSAQGDMPQIVGAVSANVTTSQQAQPPKNPGFEASDDNTVWRTDTQVEIFQISYVNGEQLITVNSDNGEKVIAPGTENSYTFKLKNTGDVALDYTVEMDAYFTPADIAIPIIGRLNRYDGTWIVGGKDEYAKVSALDTAEDTATLGAGKYTYYTLDWLWAFESGNDALDTMLGNLATDQDLVFTVVIKTTATESGDPYDNSGIAPPKTGDDMNLALWTAVALVSFAVMLLLLLWHKLDKRRYRMEADKN